MKVVEYGTNNLNVIMLLHGGGLSWWNFQDEADLLKENYHVVLPILDGHAESDAPFTSIENNAEELIEYIDEHYNGTVLAIGGLSLGAQILIEMLSQRSSICRYALIESALVIPMPVTSALIAPAFEMSYGLIKRKWFAQLQFKQLKIQDKLFEDYYRDTCKIKKQDMINFLKSNGSYTVKSSLANTSAEVMIAAGGSEQRKMLQSAELLHSAIAGSTLQILDHYYHGEFSLNHPQKYVDMLMQFAANQ